MRRCSRCGRWNYNEVFHGGTECSACRRKDRDKGAGRRSKQQAYRQTPESPIGTTPSGYIDVSYRKLAFLFGAPNGEVDSRQTMYRWVLREVASGDMVVIYDWLATSNYSEDLPNPGQFKALSSYRWRIGVFRSQMDRISASPPGAVIRFREFVSNNTEFEQFEIAKNTPKIEEKREKPIRAIELED